MSDLIFLALVVAFFVASAGLLRACEHIIGPDDVAPERDAVRSEPTEVMAP